MVRGLLLWAAVVLAPVPADAQQAPPPRVDVQTFTLGARYRVIEDDGGHQSANQVQQQLAFRARIHADRGGRVALHIGAFTGGTFNSAWNNTGLGTGDRALAIRVRQLFAAATPLRGVEVQFGSLAFARGESSEITTYDNDGYLTGGRLSVRRPRQLWVDELTITHGYLDTVHTPSVFQRAETLAQSNYRQALIVKKLGARVAASADWTDTVNGTTWHAALAVRPPGLVDLLRLEYYARPGDDAAGAALTAERRFARGVTASGGYATIDGRYGGLNGGRFNRGARLFGAVTVPIAGPLSAGAFYTHALENEFSVPVGERLDLIVTWNLLATIHRLK